MSRGLSAAVLAYAGPIFWAADIISAEGTTYHFWTGRGIKILSEHVYHPYLRINSGFRRTRSLQVDSGEIELDNTDLYIETLMLNTATFDGGICTVRQYLFGIDTLVEIMRGRLTNQERMTDAISFRLVSEFDPASFDGQPLVYSPMCRWRFKSGPCGYTGEAYAVCAKDYAACVVREQIHRFSGVPTISPDMTRVYGTGGGDNGDGGGGGVDLDGDGPLVT